MNVKRNLQVAQLSRKIKAFNKLEAMKLSHGWVYATRMAMGMSLEQLGKIMNISPQSVREIEEREREGGISLRNLNEAAKAFGLKLSYGFSSPDKSLEQIINSRARLLAEKIVFRTHKTMQLENQANSKSRLRKAIKEKTGEILDKNIKNLWD